MLQKVFFHNLHIFYTVGVPPPPPPPPLKYACKIVCSDRVLIGTTYTVVYIYLHVLISSIFLRSKHAFNIFCHYFIHIALLHAMVVILLTYQLRMSYPVKHIKCLSAINFINFNHLSHTHIMIYGYIYETKRTFYALVD